MQRILNDTMVFGYLIKDIMKKEYHCYENAMPMDMLIGVDTQLANEIDPSIRDLAANTTKTADVGAVLWNTAKNYLRNIEELIHFTNNMMFGFDLYRLTDLDSVNYNQYSSERSGEYDWHCDRNLTSAEKMFDLKLTAILNLSSEPYEGGKFELFLNGPKHIQGLDSPGSILIFPSFIPHRVTPVTAGTRKTVSLWIPGPAFR